MKKTKKILEIGNLVKIGKTSIDLQEEHLFIFNAKASEDQWDNKEKTNKVSEILEEEIFDGLIKDLDQYSFYFIPPKKQEELKGSEYITGFTRGLNTNEFEEFGKAKNEVGLVVDGPILKRTPQIYFTLFNWEDIDIEKVKEMAFYKILIGKKLYWISEHNLKKISQKS